MGKEKHWFGKTAYKVLKEIMLPVKIQGKKIPVKMKMLEGEIPLLIGRKTIEDWKMEMDFENKVAKMKWGNEVIKYDYKLDEGGHIKIKLSERENRVWKGNE